MMIINVFCYICYKLFYSRLGLVLYFFKFYFFQAGPCTLFCCGFSFPLDFCFTISSMTSDILLSTCGPSSCESDSNVCRIPTVKRLLLYSFIAKALWNFMQFFLAYVSPGALWCVYIVILHSMVLAFSRVPLMWSAAMHNLQLFLCKFVFLERRRGTLPHVRLK